MTYIIAEIGINHNGRLDLALDLIDAAARAGADAAKFQLFHMEHLKQYQLDEKQIAFLARACHHRGIEFLCTPFDRQAVDFLTPLVSQFKIGSGQANDPDFVAYVVSKGLPVILSTGMSDVTKIRQVLDRMLGPFSLLHCVSLYPTPPEKANLRRIDQLRYDFGCKVGYSDHTEGIDIALAAVALGAHIIEKHVTLDKTMEGPDHRASITPDELRNLVIGARNIEKALKH